MFSIEERNGVRPAVVYHRPTGRLPRASDRMMPVDGLGGLGELDGFLDTLKNFGSGIVKFATAGIYDPSKNRFYVPFSSGQMRNWAQGVTNTTTLGLVKTDKFFNSQTARTIGTIAGGVAAAIGTAAVGRALYTTYGPGATAPSVSSVDSGGLLRTGAQTVAKTATQTTKNIISGDTPTTTSLIPSLDTLSKVVDVGAKVIGAVGGGGAAPQGGMTVMDSGAPPVMVINQGGAPMVDPNMIAAPPGMMVQPPTGSIDPGIFFGGGGSTYSGGGGGFGPPGSEFYVDEQGNTIAVPSGVNWTPWLLAGAGAVLLYVVFPGKTKRR